MAAEDEKPGGDQFLTSPDGTGKPSPGDYARTLRPDVIAPLGLLSEMVDQRSEFRPPSCEQRFPV